MAETGQAEIASSVSDSGYSGSDFTQERPMSFMSKTSHAMAAHAPQPIQEEFTWGFFKAFFKFSSAPFIGLSFGLDFGDKAAFRESEI